MAPREPPSCAQNPPGFRIPDAFFPPKLSHARLLSSTTSYSINPSHGMRSNRSVSTASVSRGVITDRMNRLRPRLGKTRPGALSPARIPFSASPQAFLNRQAAGIWQVPRECSSTHRQAPASRNISLTKDLGKKSRTKSHRLSRRRKAATCHNYL